MPFLMQPEDFADRAFAAERAGVSYCVIPWQMGWWPNCCACCPMRCSIACLPGARASTGKTNERPQKAPEGAFSWEAWVANSDQ
jgi:hypothetical protein